MDEVKNQTDLAEYQVGDAQDKKRKYSHMVQKEFNNLPKMSFINRGNFLQL